MTGLHLIRGAPLILAAAWAPVALAADTTEPFDLGATDVEFYMGFDGIGPAGGERALYGDILLGYGLLSRLSGYVGTTLSANEHFADGNADVYLGLYGTPLDTDHFDVDLFLDFAAGGDGFDEFALTPMTEINFDLDPDQGSWGLYTRVALPLYGQPRGDDSAEHERAFDVVINPGTYFSVGERHQILIEAEMSFHPSAAEDEHTTDIGGVALGYNVSLTRDGSFEMANQVFVDIPREGEQTAVGVSTGFIVTLPSARRDSVAQVASLRR